MLKALAMGIGMFVSFQAAVPVRQPVDQSTTITGQKSSHETDNSRHSSPASLSGRDPQLAVTPTYNLGYEDAPTYPQPHISFSVPNAVPAPWSLYERIAWGGHLGLVIIGYVGIIIAIRVLKVIEAQTKCLEALAQTAIESSNTAGLALQGLIKSQRPWVLTVVTRSVEAENSFMIVAKNRGSAPAQITSCPDRVIQITNESCFTGKSDIATEESGMLRIPIMLLPGESTVIQRFCRGDVKSVCKTEEGLRRVERSEDTIYVYGSIFYRNAVVPNNTESHQTEWCCKYIHGEFTSELAMGGPFGTSRRT